MKSQNINSDLLDEAIIFATNAHKGVERRGKGFPYIVHPLEAVAIAATMTADQEILAAAVLHDVVEDTEYTLEDIEQRFGKRVAMLVNAESDIVIEGVSSKDSWYERKRYALEMLKNASREVKIVTISDKLSNIRAIARDYACLGDAFWNTFNVTDPHAHAWRYRALADVLSDLSDTEAYQEFAALVEKVFEGK